MSILNEDELSKLLKTKPDQNLWFLFGDDAYLKEFYCGKLIDQTVDKTLRAFNFHVYQDDDTSLADIFADAETLPVMSEKTCLLARNYPLTNLGSEQKKALAASLSDLPKTCVLIFYYGRVEFVYNRRQYPAWCDLIDLFQKYGVVAELSHRTPQKIARMLVKAAPERGTSISAAEAEYLIGIVGDDMQVLLNEFNKVCAFADGKPVTKQMIDETAVKTTEASVFDISEAIFEGNTDKAYAIASELLHRKTPVQPILGALASAYVNLYRTQVALNAGKTIDDFAETMGYKGNAAYPLKKVVGAAKKTPAKAVSQSLDILLDADVKSKSVAVDPAILLTEVIARLSAALQKR